MTASAPQSNNHILADNRIGHLLFKLSMPATIGMLVQALYNVVDTIFVGQGVGTVAIASLTIVFPIQMIVMAVSLMIGMGAASIISRALGAGELDRANNTLGNVILIVVGLGISVAVLANLFINPILVIFGASPTILPYARDYARIILSASILFSFAMSTNSVIRAEGRATIAMTTMLISAILNLILDPIFIFTFRLGIKGAAWATVISQATTVVYLIIYFFTGKSTLKITKSSFRLNTKLIYEMMAVGSSAFVRQVSGSFIAVIVNHTLKAYGGDISIAVYGIVNRTLSFVMMPLLGISHGVQPIVGYNYGARQFKKARRALRLGVRWTTMISLTGFLILILFPDKAVGLFTNDQDLMVIGIGAIRIVNLILPTLGFQIIGSTLFQSLGMAKKALFLTLARQILVIPLILILPVFWQLNGIWWAHPIADLAFFFVTLSMYLPQIKALDQSPEKIAPVPIPDINLIGEPETPPTL
ncbi:MAG: MATE family efflux transporter [Candidatus Marinimicrobia bacterium]|nr:MATE family efflux transporter [Candidatus Neomarinimicrobiota bacterium]MDD5230853.1 MATE family efflux transporter [Candidatus Neomarinimicrobiota bacterium]MDD5539363.1 MATE family efflux transporter [Candidatus Neomarinimicrobiota bacterium]